MKTKTVNPLYPCDNYKEYCKYEKLKGLERRFWKNLPRMWAQELQFRKEFEAALNENN